MQKFREYLGTAIDIDLDAMMQSRLASSLMVFFILWVIYMLSTYIINRYVEDVKQRYLWRKILSYVSVILGVLLVGRVWLEGMQSLATYLGLFTAGVAIALQGPITNLAGWSFIILRRPFRVGDRIQIGEHRGEVIDTRIFQIILLEIGNWVHADQSTGRIIHVPNAKIFSEILANYSEGFSYIWNEIPVLITFESDWEKAKKILMEIANQRTAHLTDAVKERVRQAAKRYMIIYSNLTPTVYTKVETSGVLLTIRYLCMPRRRRSTEQEIWEDILRAFKQHTDIEFAYPSQHVYAPELKQLRSVIGEVAQGSVSKTENGVN